MSENVHASEDATLTELLAAYAEGGFGGSFSVAEGAGLECHSCGARFPAAEAEMSSLRRMEVASDPADMVAVVALTCPRCATAGTAVLGFGPAASAEDGDVLGTASLPPSSRFFPRLETLFRAAVQLGSWPERCLAVFVCSSAVRVRL